jgi:hypothetical protein
MKDGMQSGADTTLKNVWEEICVQVQKEEFVMRKALKNFVPPTRFELVFQA